MLTRAPRAYFGEANRSNAAALNCSEPASGLAPRVALGSGGPIFRTLKTCNGELAKEVRVAPVPSNAWDALR
jgi:hypothetical protein